MHESWDAGECFAQPGRADRSENMSRSRRGRDPKGRPQAQIRDHLLAGKLAVTDVMALDRRDAEYGFAIE